MSTSRTPRLRSSGIPTPRTWRALALLYPDPEDVFDPVDTHPDDEVTRLVAHHAAVTDLHHQRASTYTIGYTPHQGGAAAATP
jgi:hypothetical protein